MSSQNATNNTSVIDLNEILNLIWDRAASDQDATYFDFVKIHDQIIMSQIRKYAMDIRKIDFSSLDNWKIEDMIESVSTELLDNITKANVDYLRHGVKIGARLLAELVI